MGTLVQREGQTHSQSIFENVAAENCWLWYTEAGGCPVSYMLCKSTAVSST